LDALKKELADLKISQLGTANKDKKPDFEKIMDNFTKIFYGMVCQQIFE
jgi:hypothetical protein